MKRFVVLLTVLTLILSLVACGGDNAPVPAQGGTGAVTKSSEIKFVTKTFGKITIEVPDVFNAVTETQDMYTSGGPESSVVVTPALEIDLLPSEWDESLAESVLEPLYGTTYSDIELAAFEGNVNMNGNTAVYLAFYGKNADGKERLVQVVRLYNKDLTQQYIITFMHSADDAFFTEEIGGRIINSITLKK